MPADYFVLGVAYLASQLALGLLDCSDGVEKFQRLCDLPDNIRY